MSYKLTVTDNQLRVIMKSLEWYFRTAMGQFFDYASEVAENGFVYDKTNPDNDRLFDEYIQRRNDSQEMFDRAYAVAAPNVYKRRKTPDMRTAIDIWHVIKHRRWLDNPNRNSADVDACEPFPTADEKLPTVEKMEKSE